MRSKLFILTPTLLFLPLLGVICTHRAPWPYLEFPPRTRYVLHAPFSWAAFIGLSLFVAFMVAPFCIQAIRGPRHREPETANRVPFPWWGWCGILLGIAAWIVAWNRFPWVGRFQAHTFTPLWVAYILLINALSLRRSGHCMITQQRSYFLLLFPLSALFWWFFEYLNRFVQNWYYMGPDFGPWEYVLYATLPFATVLPAVMGTQEWLRSFQWPQQLFGSFLPIKLPNTKTWGGIAFAMAAAGLFGLGIWPNVLFPLLWISPLLLLVYIQMMSGEAHIFSRVQLGDWHIIVSSALAALCCGFFWEMWNMYSLAKWKYSIPYVHRFQLFEMPILGYGGYLPFGLECAAIADLLRPDPDLRRYAPTVSYRSGWNRAG